MCRSESPVNRPFFIIRVWFAIVPSERPMCRSESPVNRSFFIIRVWFTIAPSERHIGRSLRLSANKKPHPIGCGVRMLALPIFLVSAMYCHAVGTIRWIVPGILLKMKNRTQLGAVFVCWHYLSSRQVTLQVLSAQMSLTSVFGMGTGGPSSQSIPTIWDGCYPSSMLKPSFRF